VKEPGNDLTRLLAAHRQGDREAFGRLLPLIYRDLQRLAKRQLGARRPGQTLDTTSLVHEAYMKLVDSDQSAYQDRGHFFAVASIAMRQIVIDYARHASAQKRGGEERGRGLDGVELAVDEQADRLLAIDQAMTRLAELDERLPRVIECRFFTGLTEEETAEALGVSTRTVERDWKRARAWLRQELYPSEPQADAGGGADGS
jgi:RNA polymerase sigma factor (TIGR02999 family)